MNEQSYTKFPLTSSNLQAKANLSLGAAASQAGLSRCYLSYLETGVKPLPNDLRDRLMRLYGYNPTSFKNFTTEDKRAKITIANVPLLGHSGARMSRNWLQVFISDQARSEIRSWPLEVKKDLGSILTKLQMGGTVGYPDTKPMSTVAKGVFEIRLKDASGIFRAFYLMKTEYGIIVFHSFRKKSQKTPKHEIETARLRLNAYLKELNDEN